MLLQPSWRSNAWTEGVDFHAPEVRPCRAQTSLSRRSCGLVCSQAVPSLPAAANEVPHVEQEHSQFAGACAAVAATAAVVVSGRVKHRQHATRGCQARSSPDEQHDDASAAYKALDRQYVNIAVPSFVQLLVEPLAGTVDTAYIGHLSRVALGGLGMAVTAQYNVTKLFNDPLLRVTTSFVAATPDENRRETVFAVMLLAFVLGISQLAMFGLATGATIRGMGVSDSMPMFQPAVAYLRIRALGAPVGSGLLALTGVCRGLGDTQTPLYASIVATVVNVVLDPILIFVLGWGCAGAALATVLAQACGVLLLLRRLQQASASWATDSATIKLRWGVLRKVLTAFVRTALIMIGRNWGKVFCFTFLAREAALQGVSVAAAYTLTFQLGFATSQVAESLATSSQVMLAQALQPKKAEELAFPPLQRAEAARRIVQRGLQIGLGLSAVLGFGTLLAQRSILAAMTSDMYVRQLVTLVMPAVLLAQVLKALAYPINGALMGALDWTFSAASMWFAGGAGVAAFTVWKQLGMVRGQGLVRAATGLQGLWLGFAAFFGTQFLLGLARIASRTGAWRALKL